MAGLAQKSSVAAFPLWSLQKQNGWVKRSQNNIKDIKGCWLLPHWCVHIGWGTWNKTIKIRFSDKIANLLKKII